MGIFPRAANFIKRSTVLQRWSFYWSPKEVSVLLKLPAFLGPPTLQLGREEGWDTPHENDTDFTVFFNEIQ